MKKRTLVTREDLGTRVLGYRGEHGAGKIVDPSPNPPLEEMADFCDAMAESRNNHDFVGTHRLLSALLFARLGREQATIILREIAEYGGLDYMSDVGTAGDRWAEGGAFSNFGIADCWKEWTLQASSDKLETEN